MKRKRLYVAAAVTLLAAGGGAWWWTQARQHDALPPIEIPAGCPKPIAHGYNLYPHSPAYVHSEFIVLWHVYSSQDSPVARFLTASERARLAPSFDNALWLDSERIFSFRDDRIGILDATGRELLPPTFDEVQFLAAATGAPIPARQGKRWGYINRNGQWVIAPQFADARPFFEGRAAVKDGKDWGYLDSDGQMVIAPQFYSVGPFNESVSYAYVCKFSQQSERSSCFVIDRTGQRREDIDEVAGIPFNRNEEWRRVIDGLFKPHALYPQEDENKRWGFVDSDGRWVIAPQYLHAHAFTEGVAAVQSPDGWGFIGHDGRWVIVPQYSDAWPFNNGVAVVGERGAQGLIDREGRLLLPQRYFLQNHVNADFSEGLVPFRRSGPVQSDDRWGFMDFQGNEVISPRYVFEGFGGRTNFWHGLVYDQVNNAAISAAGCPMARPWRRL